MWQLSPAQPTPRPRLDHRHTSEFGNIWMGKFDPYGHRSPQNLWGKVKKETSTRSFNAHLVCLVQMLRWKNPKDFDSHQSALIFPFEHIRQPSRSDGDVVMPYQLDRKYGGSRKLPYFTTEGKSENPGDIPDQVFQRASSYPSLM